MIFEFKRATLTKTGQFSGLASTFGGEPDILNDVIRPGAFSRALKTHERQATRPALLWSHDQNQPIGKWIELFETDQGLFGTGQLNLAITKARESYELLKDGAISLSIGFTLARNGAIMKGGIREITDIERLHEVSLVAIPANGQAKILEIKSPREFEKVLREKCGLSHREAKRATVGGYSAYARDEQTTLQTVTAKIDRLTQLIERDKL